MPRENRPKIGLIPLLAFSLALVWSPAFPGGAVWRVNNGESVVYLGGTMHKLPDEAYPLPVEYDFAYERSTGLVFETDIKEMNSLQTQMRIAEAALLTEGDKLVNTLQPQTYQELVRLCEEIGFSADLLSPLKPVFAMLTLLTVTLQEKGISREGVDEHFFQRAEADQKTTGALETVTAQIDYLLSLDQGQPDAFVLHSIDDLRDAWQNDTLITGVRAWHQGDDPTLYEMFVAKQQRVFPQLYDALVVSRNQNWLPAIESHLHSPGTEFVLVGIAHLLGENGIVALLEQRGYSVERIISSQSHRPEGRRSASYAANLREAVLESSAYLHRD